MKFVKLLSIALFTAFIFQSAKAQTVTVITPNGGEVLYACQSYNITWSQTGNPSNYWNIDYSSNGGATWTSVASNLLISNGTFAWTVPNLQSSTVIMRIVDAANGNVTDQSNSNFSINIPVTVNIPNGGESWLAGTTQNITWTALGTSGIFDIYYSVNGGSSWNTIVSNYTTGAGTYAWVVPNNPSAFCLVKVQDHTTSCRVDNSNTNFTIVAATPIVLTPNGTETMYMNCVYTITWNTQTFYSPVKLEYSTNSGSTWVTIVSSTSNSGAYSWTIPSTASGSCLVKASNTADLASYDVSNAVFAISPAVTVVSPNGTETLNGCSSYTITWNKTTCVGNWNIAYSADNGGSWTNIVTNLANTGVNSQSYTWYVPNNITTSQALIRVESYNNPGTYTDASNAAFNINPNNNITVSAPNGTETWIGCSSYSINWTKLSAPCNTYFDLYYSLNNGSTYNYITTVADNGQTSQSYSWSIPNTLNSSQCLIKVASDNWPTVFDVSNAAFTITPSADVTVLIPNGAEVWQGLTSHNITWSNLSGASGLYNVEYSTNNGSNWTSLASNISGNSYTWASVPNTPSTTCLVRVTDYLNPCKYDMSNAVFTISAAAPVLTYLNGGEIINVGCSSSIYWTAATFYSSVNLYYSTNGGSSYTLIASSLPNNGSYSWTVPNDASANCLIKAANSADVNVFDVSNAPFTINVPLTITAANGGESWIGCNSYNITWTKSNCLGNWNLYYSTNNGSTWTAIVNYLANSGTASQSYLWQVPNGITTTQAKIKVESYNDPSTYFDVSDAAFNINPSNDITVTAPNGGETLTALTTYVITWTNLPAASGQYSLQYSTNNGASYSSIVSNITGNSYTWTVPNTSSSQCLVKVIDYVNTCKFDVSNAPFTITPAGPVLLSPNGGETAYINCYTTITWASSTFISAVKLEYSTNNGSTWTLITSSTSNTGSYSWLVPNTVSANCIIKASNTSNLTLFDVSDAVFAIAPAATVTSPNGGETLTGCSNYTITWSKSICLGNWNLEYSTNNGVSWTTISNNISNTGANIQSYNWYVPNSITTAQGLIRVSSYSNPGTYFDASNAVFSINPNNNITVVSPNGGEVWAGCSTYNITWSKLTSPCNTSFDLYYSLNNGSTYTYFASASDNGLASQSYSWSIPNTLSGNQCLIKVVSGNWPTVFDVSDAVFTINPSVDITVTSPNGGEVWQGLSSHVITWTNLQGASGLYNIEYSINNGTNWIQLAANYSGNSYTWPIVPNTPSTACLVRVTDYLTPCKYDVSNAVFTISPATPILTSPNGGQTFKVGCGASITWTSSTYYSTVTLYYSSNGGTTWNSIATVANNGAYTWTVPNAASGNCLIKAANSADLNVFDISDAPFTISVPLTVTSANGGESWVGCSTYNITWTKSTCIGNWNISYSTDNGANWIAIANNVTNTGVASQSYPWSVPNTITTTQALIKVESYTSPGIYFDVSDAVFTINPSNDLTIITPNGGETIASLTNYNITWSNLPAASGQYDLYYSTNNGGSWTNIVSNITGNSYTWSVPNLSSTQCLIKVYDYVNSCKYDVSNAVFTITPPTPILLTPNGGETLYIGCSYNITWNPSTFISTVNLDYSTNGGITWLPILAGTANDGTQSWTIPNTQSLNCRVRASNSIDVSIFDISDASFTIAPSVQVITPNGGETLTGCSSYNITWNKTNCVGSWNIQYSLNNGVSWTNIVTNLTTTGPNSQTYIWYVPNNLTTTQGLIKVSSYLNPSTYWDQSNAVFSINPSNNIVLITPNGGETWTGCQSYNITWSKSSSPCNTNYDLYYSLNNGVSYVYFANVADNGNPTQTYSWTVPNTISSTQVLIKVVSGNWPTVFDVSNAVFNINMNVDVTVTSPNGGESLQGLSTQVITWNNSVYASGLYNIYYSTNGGSTWNTIATNVFANSYTWSVPNTPSTTCLIKVEDYLADCRFDISNANFTISPATPILLTPNGGEVLNSGQTYGITWTASTYFSTVNLYYSADNGITWNTIVTNQTNSGSYTWTVPNVNSANCLVKAANFADVTIFDVSDAVFTIKPAVKIVTPNGGESVGGCTVTSITWERSPYWNSYKIEYSTNNGASWNTIAASYSTSANPATYIWTLPNTASAQTLVRVTPTLAVSYYDQSDNVFTITHPVTIIQPNLGGTMTVGNTYNITWNSDGISNLYDIYYSTNGGTSYTNIVTAYNTSTNIYAWTVPNFPSTNCKIWVKDNTASCKQDTSDVVFTISLTAAPITVLTPNGGENLSGCFPYNITWSEPTTIGTYDILYSTNSGSSWNNIVTGYATSSHNYAWNIPNTINSSTCLIRVRSTSTPTTYDQSDALLSIHYGNLTALPSDTTVCSGHTVQLNASNGVNYTWSPSTGLSCTSCANPIATPLAGTTYTVTSTNNGCILTDTARINVFTASVTIAASPAGTICTGTSVTFTAAPVNGGTTPAYQWYLNGTPTGSNSPTFTNSGLANGNQVYCVMTSNAPCLITNTATSGTITMNVISIPAVPGTISGTTTICSGTSNTYSITAVSGATFYTWTLPGGWTGTSTTISIPSTSSSTSGNITVTSGNTCGSSSAKTLAVTVNVIPSTPGTISGLTTICSGTSNTYSVIAVSGATSYSWTLPGGWTGTSATNSITATASTTSGSITVTANNSCGNSSAQTSAIIVNTTPAMPGTISGTTPICAGSTNTYSVTAVSGASSYTWTLPNGWTGTSAAASISAAASTTSGNITVTADNTCGSSAVKTLAVIVNSIPAVPGTITGSATICQGSSNTYSITAVSGAAFYTWTLPGGWTGTSSTNSITSTAGNTSGNITVTAGNTCGSSSAQTLAATVNLIPNAPGTISGLSTICSGTSNTYSITAVSGAASYTWTLPGGWTGTSATNSITAASSTTSGNVTVTANNSCGSSSAQTLPITVNTPPAIPGTISGTTPICSGTSNTYSITAVSGATSYTWTLPNGWTGTSTTASITAAANTTSGSLTVTANNGCGGSAVKTLAVNVYSIPAAPGIITGSAAVCEGSSNIFSVTTVPDATVYNWTLPLGWTGSSTTNSITAGANNTAGNITVTAGNICGTSSAQTLAVTINPLPNVTAGGTATICAGQSTPLTSGGGILFSWLPTTGLNNPSISNPSASPTTTTTYTVTGTSASSCYATATVTITVTPGPTITPSASTSICAGSSTALSASGATAFSWLPVTGLSNPSISNPSATPSATTTYTVTGTTGLCSGTASVTITVNSIPTVTAGTAATICSGSSTPLTSGGASGFSWLPTAGLSSASISNPSASPAATTTYTVTGTSLNCSSTATVTITVNALTVSAGSDAAICQGGNTALSASGGTAFSWLPATGLSAANIANPTASPTTTTTYTVTVTSGLCSATDAVLVTVNSPPTANAGSDVSIACGGNTTLSASGGGTYSWLPATGLSNTNTANPVCTPPYSITYTVTVSNGTCSATDQVIVTAGSLTANAGTDASICTGGSTTLSGSSSALPWVDVANSYSFAQNTASFTLITGGTIVLNSGSSSMDDIVSGPFTMPSFKFNNITYTSVYISTNGFITFGSAPTSTNYNPISSSETYAGAVSGFGVDLNRAAAGTPEIRYQTVGTEFIVQYRDMGRYGSGGTLDRLSFQIRLNTVGNTVKVVYDAPGLIGAASSDPEVGLRGPNNTFTTNVHNRSVISSTGSWVNSTQGSANSSVCFFESSAPNTKPSAGTTFTWTPVSGGTTTYAWSPSTGLSSTTIANPAANPTTTTTYTLTATNGSCSAIDMVTVTVGISNANAGADAAICTGGNTNLNATGATTYSWLPATGLSAANIANPIASPTTTTSYTVTGTSGTCTSTDIVVVTVNSVPVANAGNDVSICTGNSTALSASSGSTYSWLPATGLSSAAIANPSANPSSTTTYTVTVSNGSCSSTDMVIVTVVAPPAANAGTDAAICAGNNTVLSASGGTSYTWLPAAGLSSVSIASPVASPTTTTTYTVSVSNGTCAVTDMVVVTVNTVPANAGSNAAICSGNSAALSASGGTSYSWSPGTGLSSTSIANPTANPTVTTTYTVIVSDGTCSATDSVIVAVASSLPASPSSIIGAASICAGSNQTYSVASDPNISSYAWVIPGGWNGSSVTNSITASAGSNGGIIEVTATNGCGSAAPAALNLTVNPLPTVTMSALGTVCVYSPAFTLSGGSPAGGIYSGSGVTSNTIFTPVSAGAGTFIITYVYTDGNGCSNNANSAINVDVCTGITALTDNSKSDVIVFPNPFSTYTTVHINGNIILNGSAVKVFDLTGKNVLNITNIQSYDVKIERKDLQAGIYFYQFVNDNHIVSTGKLIIN